MIGILKKRLGFNGKGTFYQTIQKNDVKPVLSKLAVVVFL